ncbi:uncharacterized protein [Aristolochia californica]|uniref:uncharacterized protein n=1 Tax=Aristolochia californica TaxID=171875 RepID=UPI0035D9FDD5
MSTKETCRHPRYPSPCLFPVVLSDCIDENLRYVLSSFKDDKLRTTELGLSKQYCSELLRDEGDNHIHSKDAVDNYGVPLCPLYKRLASNLYRCITSGTSLRASHRIENIKESELIKQKENEWNRLLSEKGLALLKTLNAVEFELHVQEPFFTQLRDGLKTVEGSCAVGNYNRIAPGDLLLFNKCLLLEVQCVRQYPSFSEMMKAEGLSKVLPGITSIEEGVQIYRKFYTKEKEKINSVLGISVSRPADQPYIHVTSILSVKGSTLTTGARALSKHVSRSRNSWWGAFSGNDYDKNQTALKVISHLITNCCWMNVYIMQPHGGVFEIRVVEGYGARWSQDGLKFIGFLEPYTEDGYSNGWKH